VAHAFTHHERPKRLECHGISRWRSGSRDVLALDAFLVGEISGASDAGHPAGLRAKIAAHIARLLCCRGPERHAHGESLADQTPRSVPAPTKVRRIQKVFNGLPWVHYLYGSMIRKRLSTKPGTIPENLIYFIRYMYVNPEHTCHKLSEAAPRK
jgi:hypothetical protein